MSTELAIFSLYRYKNQENFKEKVEEIETYITHIEWCLDVINMSEFPVDKDMEEIKIAFYETYEKLKTIIPKTKQEETKINKLEQRFEKLNEKIPSDFKLCLKKLFEVVDNFFGCGSASYKPNSQLDIDYDQNPNLINQLLYYENIKGKPNVKKNI